MILVLNNVIPFFAYSSFHAIIHTQTKSFQGKMFSRDAESSILQAMSFFPSTEQGHVERALLRRQ